LEQELELERALAEEMVLVRELALEPAWGWVLVLDWA
jgi:hypothetical protein